MAKRADDKMVECSIQAFFRPKAPKSRLWRGCVRSECVQEVSKLMSPRRLQVLVLVLLGFLGLTQTGCGRKATEADCDLIIDRNTEVAMKAINITDPNAITKKQTQIRADMKEELKDCVGRRISDTIINCVRAAQSTDEINKCMN